MSDIEFTLPKAYYSMVSSDLSQCSTEETFLMTEKIIGNWICSCKKVSFFHCKIFFHSNLHRSLSLHSFTPYALVPKTTPFNTEDISCCHNYTTTHVYPNC